MMAEVSLKIGGRSYTVACQDGEEEQLNKAAQLLHMEAESLGSTLGGLPEPRMLLMAGLMLGDRTVTVYEELERAQSALSTLERQLAKAETRISDMSAHAATVGDVKTAEDLDAMRLRAEAAEAALERVTAASEQLAMNLTN